jgi:hypothetical protein
MNDGWPKLYVLFTRHLGKASGIRCPEPRTHAGLLQTTACPVIARIQQVVLPASQVEGVNITIAAVDHRQQPALTILQERFLDVRA